MTKSQTGRDSVSRIQAIDRAATILDVVARAGPAGVGLTAIAEGAGLHTSTTRTLLSALLVQGFIGQDPASRRYTLGGRILELNRLHDVQVDLSSVAAPFLRRLWDETRETVHLSVLQNGRRVDLVVLVGPQLLNVNPTVVDRVDHGDGNIRSLFTTAAGKVLSAWAEAAAIEAQVTAAERSAAGTGFDASRARAQLARVRETGYALNVEEEEPGVCGIAAPVRDARRAVVAAVCVGYPAVRRAASYERGLVETTRAVADDISRLLGYGPQAAR